MRRLAALLALVLALSISLDADAKKKKKKKKAKDTVEETAPTSPSDPDDVTPLTPPEDAILFSGVGDVMLGSTYPDERLPPDDGATILDEVTPILSAADLAFGNLEGPMLEDGETKKCKSSKACYAFRVPTRYGTYLKEAGFDVMSLANNHANDFGPDGRASTTKVLDELGIAHSGAPGDVAHLEVKGKKVDLIAFATYEHSHNLNDLETARALVAESVKTADLVIVSFHGGAEGASRQHVPEGEEMFHSENRGDLRTFAHAMIDEGADLVVGHGPHVVRGLEVYKDRLVAYSLGNFATYGGFNLKGASGLSVILSVYLAPDGTFLGGKLDPVKQPAPGGPTLDADAEILPIVRSLSRDDFGETAVKIGKDGDLAPPTAPAVATEPTP